MNKIIGRNFILLYSLWYISNLCASISVQVLNLQERIVTTAEIGVPFLLQVVCKDCDEKQEPLGLDEIKGCLYTFRSRSQVTRNINGIYSQCYIFTYILKAEHIGVLDIGPLSMLDKHGKKIYSQPLKIKVTDVAEPDYTDKIPYRVVVSFDKSEVYLGQKVKMWIKFCYDKPFAKFSLLEKFYIPNVWWGYEQEQWNKSSIRLGQHEYACEQKFIEVYPNKVGTIVVSPIKAVCSPHASVQHNYFGGMFNFMSLSSDIVVESPACKIVVKELPETSSFKGCVAIGSFDKVTLELKQKKVVVDKGVVLKMIVEGNGNLDILDLPDLVLPEGMHSYKGKNSYQRLSDNLERKTYEWVLQADSAGVYKVPSQKFIYLDEKTDEYKTLMTNSVTLEVAGVAAAPNNMLKSKQEDVDDAITEKDVAVQLQNQATDTIEYAYNTQFQSGFLQSKQFMQWMQWAILLLAILISMLVTIKTLWPRLQRYFFVQALVCRWIFWKTLRKQNVHELYQFFERMAAAYGFGLQSEQLKQYFNQLGLSDETFQNWNNFIVMLLQFNFASHMTSDDKHMVFHLAKQWFPIILSCCKLSYQQSNKKTL